MRPVDADDLLLRLDKRMTYEAGRNHAYLKGVRDAMKEIDAARTVDAIPVEWLRDKMQKSLTTDANPFGYVLAEWLDEQGARQ